MLIESTAITNSVRVVDNKVDCRITRAGQHRVYRCSARLAVGRQSGVTAAVIVDLQIDQQAVLRALRYTRPRAEECCKNSPQHLRTI
ncbi:hypothetical protein J6590_043323 [Homalodisca vitripennis]|nr:hypothetical protein J6590_043323 [Homalodisca vitripennis]